MGSKRENHAYLLLGGPLKACYYLKVGTWTALKKIFFEDQNYA